MVRHAARPLPPRARAGVVRPDRRRHLRLPRDPDRPAGLSVPRAEPDRRALDRRPGAARRRCWPIRTGCRSPRIRSTSSCCRTRSSSHATPISCCARSIARCARTGRSLIAGFNPFSLFGARRYFGRGETPPWNGSFIALYRLKDWLALLGFEVTGGGLDCYVPPFAKEKWLSRFRFFESVGDRWWPIAGGVYFLRATKTRARHARDHPGVGAAQERRSRPRRGRRGSASSGPSEKTAEPRPSRSTPTARARAIPVPAAGERF